MEMIISFRFVCFVSVATTTHAKALAGVNNNGEYIPLTADDDLPEVSTIVSELVGIHQSSSSSSADL